MWKHSWIDIQHPHKKATQPICHNHLKSFFLSSKKLVQTNLLKTENTPTEIAWKELSPCTNTGSEWENSMINTCTWKTICLARYKYSFSFGLKFSIGNWVEKTYMV